MLAVVPCERVTLNSGSIACSRLQQREVERRDQVLTTVCVILDIGVITGMITILSTPHQRCTLSSNSISHVSRDTRERIDEVITGEFISALGSNDITQGDIRLATRYGIRHILPCTAYVNLPLGICYRHGQFVCICSELGQEGSDCTGGIYRRTICYDRLKYRTLCI